MKYDHVCVWKNSGIFCLENVNFLSENEKKAELGIIEIILEFQKTTLLKNTSSELQSKT